MWRAGIIDKRALANKGLTKQSIAKPTAKRKRASAQRARHASAALAQQPRLVPFPVPFLDGVALVRRILALGKGQFNLGPSA